MELKDYYAILGVQPTDDLKTIKTAYRAWRANITPTSVKKTMPKPNLRISPKPGKS